MRVLKDCHARTAIEVRVGSKWTTIIVLNKGPHFEQIRNEAIQGAWKEFEYDLKAAATHFLGMQQYFEITDACKKELQAIIAGGTQEPTRPPSLKLVLRDILLSVGNASVSLLAERTSATDSAIRNALSDLKNPKYCGTAGVFLTEIKQGVVYVRT